MKQDETLNEFEKQLGSLKPRPLSGKVGEAIRQQLDRDDARQPHRRPAWRVLAPLAAAACLVLAVALIGPSNNTATDDNSADNQAAPTPNPAIVLANWRVEPTGDAIYTVVAPDRIKLQRGELYIESTYSEPGPANAQALTITTPDGEAHGTGTRFYIGTHSGLTPTTSTKGPAMKRLTRILILSGVVTLTNPLGSITGRANELLAAEDDSKPAVMAVQANTSFAIDFYKHQAQRKAGNNLFFSPYSISTALTMVQEGARGETAEQMGAVLGFPKQARRVGKDKQLIPWQTSLIHTGLSEIDGRLNNTVDPDEQAKLKQEIEDLATQMNELFRQARTLKREGSHDQAKAVEQQARALDSKRTELVKQTDPTHLVTANSLWAEKTYDLNRDYLDTLETHYKTGGAFEADFLGKADAERKRMNAWTSKMTQGLIHDLLPDGSISDSTSAVLINTIYFKAAWAKKFSENETSKRDFTLASGETVSVPMMQQIKADWCRFAAFTKDGTNAPTDRFGQPLPGEDGFRILDMPYKGGTTSMILIAPEDPAGLAEIESMLSPQALRQWTKQLEETTLAIYVPRCKMQTKEPLKDRLSAMGMPLAFDRHKADLTGIQASPSQIPMYLDQVYHQTFLDINEAGTIAAAATGSALNEASEIRLEFAANRPFLFIIRDNETGTILFMGRITDPSKLQ